MKPGRRDTPRRVTPDLLDFYIKRAHALREEFPHLMAMPSLWTRSTFYSTAGFVSQETIQNYIERQSKQ